MGKLPKHIILGSLFAVLVMFSVYLVAASWADGVNLHVSGVPLTEDNLSGTVLLRLNLTIPTNSNVSNVSFYYSTNNGTWTFIGVNGTFQNSTDDAMNYTFSWATTGVADGSKLYSFQARIGNNGSIYSNSTVASNVTIDNTAPGIQLQGFAAESTAYFNGTQYRNNGTGIRFNVTANDAISPIGTCRFQSDFSGTFGTNATIVNANITNGTTVQFNFTGNVNYVNLSDGTYLWNVVCNDTLGNQASNTTNFTLIIDTTNPSSASITVPGTNTNFGNSLTVSCTGADATAGINDTVITVKGPGSESTVRKTIRDTDGSASGTVTTGSGKDITTLGTYKVDCTVKDRVGKSLAAVQKEFTVVASGGGGGGGGQTGAGRTYNILLTNKGTTRLLAVADVAKFKVGGMSHSVTVEVVGDDSASVTVASVPVTLTILIGQTKRADLDDNNVYDLAVKLVSIIDNKANLEFKTISEAYTGAPEGQEVMEEEEEMEEEAEAPTPTPTPTPTGAIWGWIVGIIAVIVVIALIVAARKKKR